jgi:LuxR family maltose regulon positive regulatory protein
VVARSTPRVDSTVLVGLGGAAHSIAVGSPAWYAWLDDASIFAFTSAQGGFIARKEQRGQNGWYWNASCKHKGTLHQADLGTSSDLTLDRLTAVASELAGRATEPPPLETPSVVHPARAAAASDPTILPSIGLPTGTVAFLFTDIEGSTQLWEQHPQAMPTALARHDTIVQAAIHTHSGVVFKTVGDSIHAVFARTGDALEAALAAQRGLAAEEWGVTGPLRVRMALHSGVAEQRAGDYFGPALNRVARILALGHGGQILLSRATHDLVADELPPQTSLRDLGEYSLKDLSRPEQLFQAVTANVPADFPPLRTMDIPPAQSWPTVAPLLATKLFIPALRPQFVPRPRLVERIQTGLLGKLTLIAAPAGFGKTTLLAEWLAQRQKAKGKSQKEAGDGDNLLPFSSSLLPLGVAWLSLDADDNDAPRFWRYLIAALETVYPATGSAALALLQSPQPPIEALLTSLINAITPMAMDAALILDDYHLISTPAIHTAITFLLDHLPPQLHLIMLTRADPPLPLTRLRMRGELTELRAADLRFTADEAAAFLTTMLGLALTSDEVAALEARTEGWVAGLQLAALAMQNRPDQSGFVAAFSGSNRFVVDYLVEEVLERLPSHLQTFVLQTSILDRLCGPLCDALLLGGEPAIGRGAQAYSQVVLEELERANLFLVPLDDERRWYRYHHLFAEVLRARLHSGATASEVAMLHQRASVWHEQAGLIGEAVRYAFLMDDVERATALIERHAMAMLLASSDVFLVRAWVEQVPRALISGRPRLALITGFILALMGQFEAVEQLLADAAPAFSAPDLPPNIVGELALLRSMLARVQGEADHTRTFAQQALAQLDPDNYGLRAGASLYLAVAAMWRGELTVAKEALAEAAALGEAGGSQWIALAALEELTSLQGRHGQLREMLRTAAQAAQLSARLGGQQLPAAGMGHVAIAEVLYEWNDLAGAAHAATQGIDLLRRSVERLMLVRGYIALAHVHQARGDGEGALDTLDRCEAWFAQTPIEATGAARAWLAAYRARLWVQQGDLSAATGWAHECSFAGDSELGYVQQLTLVWLRLAQSQNDSGGQLLGEASAMLAELLSTLEARGWTHYLIECLVLQALVRQASEDRSSALTALERALTLAAPERYVRVFVDAGASMAALLAQSAALRPIRQAQEPRKAQSDSVRRYAELLLAAFPEGQAGARKAQNNDPPVLRSTLERSNALVEPLSERELEVLRLIADGHSNQAIADRLVVAVSTVKRHINNIYGKLAVQSRTQALLRARELNLL